MPEGYYRHVAVAPLAGAWIETMNNGIYTVTEGVAPLAGAWIETFIPYLDSKTKEVAPLAGAWIETRHFGCMRPHFRGRAPRGRVD